METAAKLKPIKDHFPLLVDPAQGTLVYLDSAASAQKPKRVIDAITNFYSNSYANVHRGVYELSEKASLKFEMARDSVQSFIGAASREEIIFTRGATEAINLVCYTYGEHCIPAGSEVIVTILEHHANFVPWQQLCHRRGLKFTVIGLTADGEFDREAYSQALSSKTKLVAMTHLSNALGLELPVKEMIAEAQAVGAVTVLDGSQSIAHVEVNVVDLAADFFVFSGHKLYGPTGIGVLYGKQKLLDGMPPFNFGGDMIRSVGVERTEFNDLPYKFEAGTPHIAGAIGLHEALDFVSGVGRSTIMAHEMQLVRALEERLSEIKHVRLLGPKGSHKALVTFDMPGLHPHDIAQFLSKYGICVRGGHHCAQPLLHALGLKASTRASLGMYNTISDIDFLAKKLAEAVSFFRL